MLQLAEFKYYFKKGTSQCFLGKCNEGNYWVIRLKKKDKNSKRLFSQYLASNLAQLIGISTPGSTLINVNLDLLEEFPAKFVEFDSDCSIGVGTRFIQDITPFPTPPDYPNSLRSKDFDEINIKHLNKFINSKTDFDQLYGMRVFTDWIKINDYHKYENLYINSKQNIIFIDFDIAFSTANGSFDLPENYDFIEMINHQAPFWEGLEEELSNYEEWFSRILNVSDSAVFEILNIIPTEWLIPNSYPESLMKFILNNRDHFISEFKHALDFRNTN